MCRKLDNLPPPVGKNRPFPWRCSGCKAKEVFPKATDYSTTRKHEGRSYAIRIPDLAIPTCRKCGAQTFSVGDDDRILEALRAAAGLLTPQEIQQGRARFGLTQQELADQLGAAKETICRWETGGMIQSRAMDNLLRLYFESEEVRGLLRCNFKKEATNNTQDSRSPKFRRKLLPRRQENHLDPKNDQTLKKGLGKFRYANPENFSKPFSLHPSQN